MKAIKSVSTLPVPQSYQQGWEIAQQQLDRQLYVRPAKTKSQGKTAR
ncbi:MAG: hypothetical protein AAF944_07825 [Bacteroidota bacterium]